MRFPAPSGVVTFTTDFGLDDHYAGAMKGVVLSIFPAARLIDITHGVRPYSVAQGAFYLAQAWRWFPEGTVHVAVVDPGVGGPRSALAAEAGGSYFIAPDNGVLSQVFEQAPPRVRTLDVKRFNLEKVSRTFHGRDVFAPSAAMLASGTPLAELGSETDDWVRLPPAAPVEEQPNRWRGAVLNIDRFGNIVTNFPPNLLTGANTFVLRAGALEVSRNSDTYEAVPPDRPFLIAGSAGLLEVSLNRRSAAELACVEIGDPLELRLHRSSP